MVSFPRYEKYKDSGVEWLGEIPEHWGIKKLKYVAKIINGSTPSSSNNKYWNGNFVWVTPNDLGKLKNKFISDSARKITISGIHSCGTQITPKNSVILSTRAPIGHAAVTTIPSCTNQGCKTLVLDIQKFDSIYLYYLLQISKKSLQSHGEGTTFQELGSNELKSYKVVIPPFSEQKQIVEFLDRKTEEIDRAIAHKKRLIELLEEQKTILINQAVTKGLNPNAPMKDSGIEWLGEIPEHWEVKRAKYLLKEVDERSQTGEEELLSVSHITGVTPRSEKNVNMFMAEDYTGSKICKKDDLVINIMWAWMGALGVSDQVGIISSSYSVFRQHQQDTFNSWFLEHLLRSKEYVSQYNRLSTGLRSSRLRLYADTFLKQPILLPSKQEQDQIKSEVKEKTKETDKAINSIEKQIEKLTELKQILIAEAVTGKIKI
mgnify:CR=1 FL=1